MIDKRTIFQTPTVRLRVIRQALDIKQITFAKFMHICTMTLRRWEHYGYYLTPQHRDRLRHVGVNAQWLEYGTGEPFEYDLDTVREKILFTVKQSH